MRPAKLLEIEAVIAIARGGSFRAAARALDTSPTAVGNAVANLEDELGVRLFDRTTRRVVLTAAGQDFVHAVAPALAAIHDATEAARTSRHGPSGTLRINCSIAGGHQLLVPFVTEFLRRYPNTKVDIVTEGQLVDVAQAGFDAGVRAEDMIPPGMTVVSLNQKLRNVVVGSPGYFETRPRPEAPGDLLHHACIRIRWPSGAPYEWEFERDGEEVEVDVPWSLSLDNHSLIVRAALAGVGLAYTPEDAIKEHLGAGRLVAVLRDWVQAIPGFCLYFPARRRAAGLVGSFVQVIQEMRPSSSEQPACGHVERAHPKR